MKPNYSISITQSLTLVGLNCIMEISYSRSKETFLMVKWVGVICVTRT